jgi:2'-5' RNA ligase
VPDVQADDQTALIVPAPDAEPLVGGFRARHSADARAGVPAHLTIMFPFLEPAAVSDDVLRALEDVFAAEPAFDYTLVAVREFKDGGVLYLAPEPAAPFLRLTERIAGRFGVKPYGGAYLEAIPHLTVGEDIPSDERERVAGALTRALPLPAHATQAWLMVGRTDRTWTRSHVFAFAAHTLR